MCMVIDLLWTQYQQFLNKILRFIRDLLKQLIIKVIVSHGHVEERLLVSLALEWGVASHPVRGNGVTCGIMGELFSYTYIWSMTFLNSLHRVRYVCYLITKL